MYATNIYPEIYDTNRDSIIVKIIVTRYCTIRKIL